MKSLGPALLISLGAWLTLAGFFLSPILLIAGFLLVLIGIGLLAWAYPREEDLDVPAFMREGRPTL